MPRCPIKKPKSGSCLSTLAKDASWRLANDWWEEQKRLIDNAPPTEEDRRANAFKVWSMVQEWGQIDEENRERLVDSLVGTGQYQKIKDQAQAMASSAKAAPGRSIGEQVDEWKRFLHAACQARQMSEGRFDAYCRNIGNFVAWVGPETAIDSIDEGKLEGYFTHLSVQVAAKKYSPNYCHTLLMTAKQLICRLAELRLIPLPGNIRSRRLRFNHSAPQKIETFTVQEIQNLLRVCDSFSSRTKLYILLMLNCGMYQNDIAELRKDEVNWKRGTISRSRSKTRERKGPIVTYKLWPETLSLLKQHRSHGELLVTTDEGNPLVRYWLKDGEMRRYDVVQSAWTRLAAKMGVRKIRLGMKHLRKTSASLLAKHPLYKFYANHFLADSPRTVADRHYVTPSDEEFFEAQDWLRKELLG